MSDPAPEDKDKKPEDKPAEEPKNRELNDQEVESALSVMGFAPKQPPKKEEKKPDKPPEPDKPVESKVDPEKKDEKKPEPVKKDDDEPPKPEPTPTVTKKPSPDARAEEIARKTAERVLEEQRKSAKDVKKDPTTPPPASEIELTEHEKEDLGIIKMLEDIDPDRYRDIGKKTKNWMTNVLLPYKAEWIRKNPGEEFDPDDAEHSAIYDRQPSIEDDDFKKAEKAYEKKKIREEVLREVRPEIEDLRAQHATERLMPKILKSAEDSINEMVKEVDEELFKLTAEGVDKMIEADPLAGKIISAAADSFGTLLVELDKLSTPELRHKFDPKKQEHAVLADFAREYEQEILSMPADKQVWKGRKFTTQQEFNAMSEEDKGKHWILTGPDIRKVLCKRFTEKVKNSVEAAREEAQKSLVRRGYKAPPASDKTPTEDPAKDEPKPEPEPRGKPPALTSSSDKRNGGAAPTGETRDLAEQVGDILFGR